MYKPVIVKHEVNDEHYYMVDGKYHPSVTKVLHETLPTPIALKQWLGDVGNERATEKFEKAAVRGTYLHNVAERLLMGEEIKAYEDLTLDSDRKVIAGFQNWFSEYNPRVPLQSEILEKGNPVPSIEMTLASTLGYAGTLDFFCYIDNEPYILDIKTSAGVYDSHFLQLTAYQHAFFEMTGIKAKRGLLHLSPKVKGGCKFYKDEDIKIAKKPVDIEAFKAVWNLFLVLNGGEIPQPPLAAVYPQIFKLNDRED